MTPRPSDSSWTPPDRAPERADLVPDLVPDLGPASPPDLPDPRDPPETAGAQVPPAGRGAPNAGSGDRHRRRWPAVLMGAVALALVLVLIAGHIELDLYVLTPGEAQAVGPLVRVPAARAHQLRGSILLTDVYVTRVTLLSYLPDKLNGDAQMLPAVTVLGPDTPAAQLTAQGFLEMAQAQAAAKAAALTRLGFRVGEHDAGTLVFGVVPGSPATGALQVAQTVTAVDGKPTPSSCAFVAALQPYRPGETVSLAVERSTVTASAAMRSGPSVIRKVRLGRRPASMTPAPDTGCPGAEAPGAGYLGVEVETRQAFSYPFPVSVRTSTIGGPSAGLAMTLTIVDKLAGGGLTGGRSVAATGTIDPQGTVGDVGGVAEKTVAVERAGATVFLVPPEEYAAAESKDIPSLRIFKVSSLDQALSVLRRLGGRVPPDKPSPSRGG